MTALRPVAWEAWVAEAKAKVWLRARTIAEYHARSASFLFQEGGVCAGHCG